MIISINSHGLPTQRQHDLRQWYAENGLSTAELVEPLLVDTDTAEIRINRIVDLSQGVADFPEVRVDDDNNAITEQVTAPLRTPLPIWLYAQVPDGQRNLKASRKR